MTGPHAGSTEETGTHKEAPGLIHHESGGQDQPLKSRHQDEEGGRRTRRSVVHHKQGPHPTSRQQPTKGDQTPHSWRGRKHGTWDWTRKEGQHRRDTLRDPRSPTGAPAVADVA